MDVSILAAEIAAFLAPYLPDLAKLGGKAAEEASKKLGSDAFESAKGLWGRLRPKVEAKPAAQEAVMDVAASPEDKDAQAALRLQLKKILAEDETLVQEILGLWQEAKARNAGAVAKGERSVAVSGNVSKSVIVTGDGNQVG
ncbi:MAG: hypothetical protein JW999_07910 [Methanotrichaceae archaeon]|nr:hypothetical protein [Methanotrichaceae archaeon]